MPKVRFQALSDSVATDIQLFNADWLRQQQEGKFVCVVLACCLLTPCLQLDPSPPPQWPEEAVGQQRPGS